MQEQSILGGLVVRTQRRAHDLQVIGKVSSRVEIRDLSSKQVTGMSSLRTHNLPIQKRQGKIVYNCENNSQLTN